MKLFCKVVDERQELEMMRIERSAFWLMFFMLFAAMIIQSILPDFDVRSIAGEVIVLAVVAVWMTVKEIRYGAWDYFTNPGMRVYLGYSLIGGFIGGGAVALVAYFKANAPVSECLKQAAITAVFTFAACFVLMLLAGTAVKRQRKKLQQESEEAQE